MSAWRRVWDQVIPFTFPGSAPGDLTTNARKRNARVRKIIKTRGHFPTDEAATRKLIWLALRNATVDWKSSIKRTGKRR